MVWVFFDLVFYNESHPTSSHLLQSANSDVSAAALLQLAGSICVGVALYAGVAVSADPIELKRDHALALAYCPDYPAVGRKDPSPTRINVETQALSDRHDHVRHQDRCNRRPRRNAGAPVLTIGTQGSPCLY